MRLVFVPVVLAVGLLIHHYSIHPCLRGGDRLFQVRDVRSHEAWIVALFAFSLGAAVQELQK